MDGPASGVFRLGVHRLVRVNGRLASAYITCRPLCADAGWECRARCHSPYPAVSCRPAPYGATSPRHGAGRNRVPSIGVGPRAASLALTLPARVPAGQRVNVPGMYVRHEALFVRMEVEDLDLSAVAAAG